MAESRNNSTKDCRWCGNDIQKVAKICHQCGRDQYLIWGLLQRFAPIGLIVGVIGVLLAMWSANQAGQERVKAEEAVARAEEALAEAVSSQEIATRARADAKQVATDLKHLIADADKRKGDFNKLIEQLMQADMQLSDLTARVSTVRDNLDTARRNADQVASNLEAQISSLDSTSQKLADVVYANEFSADVSDFLDVGRALASCDIEFETGQALDLNSVQCLGDILVVRGRFARIVIHADTYRDEMAPEAWGQTISSALCYRLDSLMNGYFRASISDYANNRTWRNWTGYAQDIISRTKPYIEENSEMLTLCKNRTYSFPMSTIPIFVPGIGDVAKGDDLRRIELAPPDPGIVLVYDDETRIIYEWRLGEEPKIRVTKHTQD